jgi:broad specificity phosphatase PhoE
MGLLIIRHAESVENADKYNGFYQNPRPYDALAAHRISRQVVGLTPKGFRQAQWLGEILPTIASDDKQVYTSRYRRAIDTALIALPKLAEPWPRQTALLDEQHYGEATYMTKGELYATYPDTADERRYRKHLWTAPGGGESLTEGVSQRAADFIQIARHQLDTTESVVAFTHQTAAIALRSLLEDRPLVDILREEKTAKMANAAILHYAVREGRFVKQGTIAPPCEET